MYLRTDSEGEKRLLSENRMNVPLEICIKDGRAETEVYPSAESAAEKYLSYFSDPSFCTSSGFASLADEIVLSLYKDKSKDCRWYVNHDIIFVKKSSDIRSYSGRAEITGDYSHFDFSSFETVPEYRTENDILSLIREGDKVLAYAGINDFPYDENCTEIYTECAEKERRRGLGTDCVLTLLSYLKGKSDVDIEYVTFDDNLPSIALAEKCKFIKDREVISLITMKGD